MKIEAAFRLLASAWTGSFEIDLPPDIKAIVQTTMNELSARYPSISHIRVIEGDPDILDAAGALATKSVNSIILHPTVWLDHGKLKKHEQDWHEAMVDPSIKGLVVHEVGHILDGQVLRKLGSKKYNAIIGKHIRDFLAIYTDEAPSAYGQENVAEFLAEAFTAHYLGKHALTVSNDLTKRSLAICNAIWDEFNEVLNNKSTKPLRKTK